MKKLYLLLLLIASIHGYAQNWERIYGLSNRNEIFRNLAESYDNGYLVLGAYNYYPNTRGWLIKTDINGNPLYELSFGTGTGMSQGNYPSYVEPTRDGGMIICGSHDRWTINDIGVTKLDACGNLEWCKIFRTDGIPDFGVEIRQLPDDGYIMMTQQYNASYIVRDTRVHLFRFDSSGNLLWIEPYASLANHPQIYDNAIYDLEISDKGDYLINGFCYWCDDSILTINTICRLKAMTILADSNKQEKWVRVFKYNDTLSYSTAGWATQKQNGNFYVGAGYRNADGYPVMLLVMDSLGNYIRDTLPQIPDMGNKWAEGGIGDPMFTEDGRLFTHTFMVDSSNLYLNWFGLHELDSLGGWHNSFLHPTAHYEARTIMTHDEKILAGAVTGFEYGQDIILMKFNTSLQYDSIYTAPRTYDYLCPDSIVSKTIDLAPCSIIVDVADIPTPEEYYKGIQLIPITPAPNPATDYIRFLLKNTEHHRNTRIVCYDMFGRQLVEMPVNSGVDESGLDVSDWHAGMYMAVVYAGNKKVGATRFIVSGW